jgi:ferredoxin
MFAQAVPAKPVIDPVHCRKLTEGKCGVCAKICPTGAIRYDDKDRVSTETYGAVIFATGYELIDWKKIYGEYQNVKLTDEELEKLKAEFPDWNERIERLSEYIDSKGDKYKNHLSTIRSWARRDKEKGNGTNQLGGQTNRNESNLAAIEEAVRTAEARRKAGAMGTVQAGGHPADQGVRTTYPWQRPKV